MKEVFEQIRGLVPEDAEKVLLERGIRYRFLTDPSGNKYVVTRDYVPGRMNLSFSSGKVSGFVEG